MRPGSGFTTGYMPARDHRDGQNLFRRSVTIWIREDEEDADDRMELSDDYGDGQCMGFWPGEKRTFGSFANVFPAIWSQKDKDTSGAYPIWDRTLEPDERYRLLEEEPGDDRLPFGPEVYTPTTADGTDGDKNPSDELKVVTSWGRVVPEGQSGIIIPGTAESVQASVFMPTWDGALVAQWNGLDNPEYSTRVVDIDERRHSEGNIAGVHSFWKIEVLPDGKTANGVDHEGRSMLAWNLTGHTTDPVGFGLVIGVGNDTDDKGTSTTENRDEDLAQEEGTESPPMIRAFMSAEQGGPLHVGASSDQHQIYPAFSTVDGKTHGAINAGHINTQAPFFASPSYDAPLAFEARPEPRPVLSTGAPFRTSLTLKPDEPHGWGAGNQGIGLWMWHTRVPLYVPKKPKDPTPGGGRGNEPVIPGGPRTPGGGGGGGRVFSSPSGFFSGGGGSSHGPHGGRLVDPRGGDVIPGGRTRRPPGLGPLKPVEGTERTYPGTSEDLARRARKRKEERERKERRKKEEREAKRRRKREERRRKEEERKRRAREEKERRKEERKPKPQLLPPGPDSDVYFPPFDDDETVIVYGPNGEPHLIKKKNLEKLKGPPRLYTPLQEPVQVIGSPADFGVPALTFKANVFCPGDEKDDLRYNTGAWTEEQLDKWNRRPAVLRVEAYGHETCANGHFDNEDTGQRYADMPTVTGGIAFLPASVGMEDRGSSFAPDGRTVSEGHVTLLKDKVFLAFAEPDITSGGVKNGFRMGTAEDGGDLVVYAVDSSGADTERLALTSGGLLALGGRTNAFPALKRSGTSIQARLGDDSGYAVLDGLRVLGRDYIGAYDVVNGAGSYRAALYPVALSADVDLLLPDADGETLTTEESVTATLAAHVAAADPHTGYLLADGSRALGGDWDMGAEVMARLPSLTDAQAVAAISGATAGFMYWNSDTGLVEIVV